MHPSLKKALKATQNAMANPIAQKVGKAAREAVVIASQVATAKSPLAVGLAALSAVETLRQTFDIQVNRPDPVSERGNALGLIARQDLTPSVAEQLSLALYHSAARGEQFWQGVWKTLHDDYTLMFFQTSLGGFDVLYGITKASGGEIEGRQLVWTARECPLSVFTPLVWEEQPTRDVRLKYEEVVQRSGGVMESWTFSGVEERGNPYLGKHSPADMLAKMGKYKAKGMALATVLHGPPGSGKTTYVRKIAKLGHLHLLEIPHDCIEEMPPPGLLRLLNPDMILIDDIDHEDPHGHSALADTLHNIDEIRKILPLAAIFSTANDLYDGMTKTRAAMLRPDRLGDIVEFGGPDVADRVELLDSYFRQYGVDPSAFDLPELAGAMLHARYTHDYVRQIAVNAVVDTQAELLARIQRTLLYFNALPKATAKAESED